MDYLKSLAGTFDVNALHGRDQLSKSRDLPAESAGAFHHARLACEYFRAAECVGEGYKCCGENELTAVRLGLTDSRNRLNTCCGAQRDEVAE